MRGRRTRAAGRNGVSFSLSKRLAAEALGAGLLVATVVGSGIMAERLAGGNIALALLGNTLPTGAILVVLILAFGPISGAHFNPAVSLAMSLRGDLPWRDCVPYIAAQIIGACLGTLVAHGMFELPLIEFGIKARTGPAQWFAEFVATFGLLVTILAISRFRNEAVPVAVGLYITAAYWFTASTSFANPAVTIARALTRSFAGVAPADVPMFIIAQLAGALAGLALMYWLLSPTPAIAADMAVKRS
jgi:glycerol uptake facilitator-like aquaporin